MNYTLPGSKYTPSVLAVNVYFLLPHMKVATLQFFLQHIVHVCVWSLICTPRKPPASFKTEILHEKYKQGKQSRKNMISCFPHWRAIQHIQRHTLIKLTKYALAYVTWPFWYHSQSSHVWLDQCQNSFSDLEWVLISQILNNMRRTQCHGLCRGFSTDTMLDRHRIFQRNVLSTSFQSKN